MKILYWRRDLQSNYRLVKLMDIFLVASYLDHANDTCLLYTLSLQLITSGKIMSSKYREIIIGMDLSSKNKGNKEWLLSKATQNYMTLSLYLCCTLVPRRGGENDRLVTVNTSANSGDV